MQIDKSPKYSLVVPVYNVENYLPDCLESISCQTYKDFEVIFVNDGSTDSSLSICEDFCKREPSIESRIITQQNKGLLIARRTGFNASRGQYLCTLDSDDTLHPEALEIVDRYQQEYNPDLIIFEYSFDSKFRDARSMAAFQEVKVFTEENKGELINAYCQGKLNNVVTKVVRRPCLLAGGNYEEYTGLCSGEDQLQSLSILNEASTAVYIPTPLYWYRENFQSITSSYSKARIDDAVTVKSEQLEYAKDWESEYGLSGLQDAFKCRFLRDMFYDARKSIRLSNYKDLISDIVGTDLYTQAYPLAKNLRHDVRAFYTLVNRGQYFLAFTTCLAHRLVMLCSHKAAAAISGPS